MTRFLTTVCIKSDKLGQKSTKRAEEQHKRENNRLCSAKSVGYAYSQTAGPCTHRWGRELQFGLGRVSRASLHPHLRGCWLSPTTEIFSFRRLIACNIQCWIRTLSVPKISQQKCSLAYSNWVTKHLHVRSVLLGGLNCCDFK